MAIAPIEALANLILKKYVIQCRPKHKPMASKPSHSFVVNALKYLLISINGVIRTIATPKRLNPIVISLALTDLINTGTKDIQITAHRAININRIGTGIMDIVQLRVAGAHSSTRHKNIRFNIIYIMRTANYVDSEQMKRCYIVICSLM